MQFGRKRFLPLLLALSMLLTLLPIPAAAFQPGPMEVWEVGQAPVPSAPFSTGPFTEPEQNLQSPFSTGPFTEPEPGGQAVSDGDLPTSAPEDVFATPHRDPAFLRGGPITPLGNGIVITSSGQVDFSATIIWNDNDNNGDTNAVKRPLPDAAKAHYTLSFSYNGNNYTLPGDCDKLGYHTSPEQTLADGRLSWTYSVNGLPTQITIGEGAQAPTYDVTYKLTQTPFDKYLPKTSSEAGNGDIIKNTVTQKWSGTIRWFDDKSYYGTRPDEDDVKNHTKVYRYVPGQPAVELTAADGVTLKIGDLQEDSEGREFYEITLEDAPAYDQDGMNYTYYIDPHADTKKPDAGTYTFLYVNKDNYASLTDALYNNGTATFTLTNTTGFAVTKDWSDGGNPNRPNADLYLYRVPVKMVNGSPDLDIGTARPVQGYDDMDVRKDDGIITIAENGKLPMYDASGCKYVYFAREIGLTGEDYHFIINNTGSAEDEKIIQAFEDVTTTYLEQGDTKLTTPTYVLSDGIVTNKKIAAAAIPVTKAFKAQAMQNMEGASVTMQLQWKAEGSTDWQPVLTKEAAEAAGTTTPLLSGTPTVTIDDFSSERMTLTATDPVVDKYDADGKKVTYRWVESSMTISGDSVPLDGAWTPDPQQPDRYTYGAGTLVSVGDVGPGLNGNRTTAYFSPAMTVDPDGSTTVTNTLVGKTQVQVKKTWNPQPADGTTATIRLRRVEDGLMSGAGLIDAKGDPVADITLSETTSWTGMWPDLVRYNENGVEYTYEVAETKVTGDTNPWTTDITYEKSIASDGAVRWTQLTANVKNSTGTGKNLEFEVKKQWLDGGDLLTRKPVNVALYRINAAGTGYEYVTQATLNAANNWWHEFDVTPTVEGDTVENYLIKEEFAASTKRIDVVYTATDTEIYDQAISTASDTDYPYNKKVGTLGADDTEGLLGYVYNVYIQRTSVNTEKTHSKWQISNQRTGVMTIDLNKTWLAGGEAPAAEFKLTRTGGSETDKEIETVTLGDALHPAVSDGDMKRATYTFTDATYGGLRKYDDQGGQYSYDLKEISVDGKPIGSGGSVTLDSGDRYVTGLSLSKIDIKGGANHHTGDVYTYSAHNNKADSYRLVARKLWRDGGTKSGGVARPDIYFNVYRVADNYAYDGTTLEQLAKDEESQRLTQGLEVALQETLDPSTPPEKKAVTLISADKLWNTKHNDWYWSCDLGVVQRYDANGNRYIYFLKENISGNAGNYQDPVYYNAPYNKVAADAWRPKDIAAPLTSEDVFGVPRATMESFCGGVLTLADGTNSGTNGSYDEYYSGTVMNYQQEDRTVSLRKIWKMPAGWPYLTDQMQTIDVELWRTTKPIKDGSGNIKLICTNQEIQAAIHATSSTMKQVNGTELKYPFTHTFEKTDPIITGEPEAKGLARYDEWGDPYYYYLYETTSLAAFENTMVTFNTGEFSITNTYEPKPPHVEVEVQKTWNSQVTDEDAKDLASAEFKLYARMTSDGNVPIGSPILMSTMKLEPSSLGAGASGTLSRKFIYLTGSDLHPEGTSSAYMKLPYLAPNGHPFAYWVEEAALPSGYTVTPVRGYDEKHLVDLTPDNPNDPTLYTGDAAYTNAYTGDKTTASFTKTWSDYNSYIDNSGYRPAKVEFTIYRKAGAGGAGEPATYKDGSSVTVMLPDNGNWNKTIGETGSELPKYDPQGKEYTYYVQSEEMLAANDSVDPIATALYTNNVAGASRKNVTNTLKTTLLTAKKAWENGGAGGAALTYKEFTDLSSMGALPYAIGFVVQRQEGVDWVDVDAKQGGTGNVIDMGGGKEVVGKQYVTSTITTQAEFNAFATGVTFAMLPALKPDGITGINYRVAELVWAKQGDAPQRIHLGAAPAAFPVADPDFKGGTASIEGAGSTYTATNTLDLTKAALRKVWADDGNRENTRPTSLPVTVTKTGETTGISDTLINTGADFIWTKDNVYLPTPVYGTISDGYMSVGETLPTGSGYAPIGTYTYEGGTYTQGWENNTYTLINAYDFTRSRATVSLEATKFFVLDGDWADITRPPIELSLQYRDRTDASIWHDIDQTNIKDFATSDGGVYPTPTQTLTIPTNTPSGTVKWPGMYRYWNEHAHGSATPIQYRVVERVPSGAPYTTVQGGDKVAFGTPAATGLCTANITNTLTLHTGGIELKKTWKDVDDGDVPALIDLGALPETLSFKLQYSSDGRTTWHDVPGGTDTMNTADLLAGKQWPIDLPTHDKGGNKLEYRAVETEAVFKTDTGTVTIARKDLGNITLNESDAVEPGDPAQITNTYERTEVTVEKEWDDKNDRERKRPDKVTVQLSRDGKAYGAPVELTKAKNWKHTWELLPLNQNAKSDGNIVPSVYTVKETAVPHYTSSQTTRGGTKVITNTYAPKPISVTAEKEWDDGGDPYGLRPKSAALTIQASTDAADWSNPITPVRVADQSQATDPETVYTTSAITQTVTPGSGWTCTWDGLSSYVSDGNATKTVHYRVVEESQPAGYAAVPSGTTSIDTEGTVLLVENALDPNEITYWTVALEFDGADMKQAVKDEGISGVEVRLQYRTAGGWTDAAPTGGAAVLSDGNLWAHTFENLLPGYEYRVVSRKLTERGGTLPTQGHDGPRKDEERGHTGPYGYISEYDPDGDPRQQQKHTLIIMTYAKGSLRVAKVWKGGGAKPAVVEVQLWRNNTDLLYTVPLDASNGWSHTWTELPVFDPTGATYAYAVKEISNLSAQFTVAISPATAELAEGKTTDVTVTNTYIPPPPSGGTRYDFPLMPSDSGFGGVRVHKTVIDPYGRTGRFNFTMTLSDPWVNGRYGDLLFANGVAQFSLPHNGSVTADGLPAGVTYTITEQETDGYISYAQNARGVVTNGQMALASFENRGVKPVPKTSDDDALLMLPVALGVSLLGLIACLIMRRRMGKGSKEKGRGKDARLRAVMLLICCCFALTTVANGVLLGMEALEYANSADTYDKLTGFVEFIPKATDKPVIDTIYEDAQPALEASTVAVDFTGLKLTGPDVVAWLLQEDTALNYPIVQGRDNDYYLRRLYNGAASKAGSLFMDYENKAGFADGNTVVYGHNMRDGSMFASLLGYAEQAYYDGHRTMRLVTEEGEYTLRVFAAFYADPAESGTARSPWAIAWEDRAAYGAWLEAMAGRSLIQSGFRPTPESRVMTLSTCTRDGDGRFVVIGELTGVDEA